MASTEVLTALESLHRELEKLEPAIRHVETAQEVTRTVKGIPIKHIELLKEVKEIDLKHKQELKDIFSKEIGVIISENTKLAGNAGIVMKQTRENDLKHKKELKELFIEELVSITQENSKLANVTDAIQKQVAIEQVSMMALRNKVQSFHEKVEKINFPERLDKLDANIAGIMAGLQSVQSRLDGLERNIIDRLKDLGDYQKESRMLNKTKTEEFQSFIISKLEVGSKKQQTNAHITWGLIVGTIFLLLLFISLRLLAIRL